MLRRREPRQHRVVGGHRPKGRARKRSAGAATKIVLWGCRTVVRIPYSARRTATSRTAASTTKTTEAITARRCAGAHPVPLAPRCVDVPGSSRSSKGGALGIDPHLLQQTS